MDNRNDYHKLYRKKNLEKIRDISNRYNAKLRLDAIKAYSNNKNECACCEENIIEFLTIDHIENDGAVHRKLLGSVRLTQWLKNNNYPPGFQILCQNCNSAKFIYKKCPHKKEGG